MSPAEHPRGPLPTPHTDVCRKSPPPPRPSRCDMRKPFRVNLGGIGDEPATEAHHLSYRGSRFSGVYPPSSSLLGLSRSWQQDTETALIVLQGDPRYPPRKLLTHVPTRAVLRTASYRVEVPVAAKAPGHPPYLPRESPRLLLTPGEASHTHTLASVFPSYPASSAPPPLHTHPRPSFLVTPHHVSPPFPPHTPAPPPPPTHPKASAGEVMGVCQVFQRTLCVLKCVV